MSEIMAKILLTGATCYIGGTVLDHLIRSEEPSIKRLTINAFVRDKKAAEVLLEAYGDRMRPILWTAFTDIPFVTDTAGHYDIINTGVGSSQTRPRPLTLVSCLARPRLSRRGFAMSSWRSLRRRSWAVSWIWLSGAGQAQGHERNSGEEVIRLGWNPTRLDEAWKQDYRGVLNSLEHEISGNSLERSVGSRGYVYHQRFTNANQIRYCTSDCTTKTIGRPRWAALYDNLRSLRGLL